MGSCLERQRAIGPVARRCRGFRFGDSSSRGQDVTGVRVGARGTPIRHGSRLRPGLLSGEVVQIAVGKTSSCNGSATTNAPSVDTRA